MTLVGIVYIIILLLMLVVAVCFDFGTVTICSHKEYASILQKVVKHCKICCS